MARCHIRLCVVPFQAFSKLFTCVVNITTIVYVKGFILMLANTQIKSLQYFFIRRLFFGIFERKIISLSKLPQPEWVLLSGKVILNRNWEFLILFCFSNNNSFLFNIYISSCLFFSTLYLLKLKFIIYISEIAFMWIIF